MIPALNNAQLEILKVLQYLKEEKDLAEMESLLVAYLSDKVVRMPLLMRRDTVLK